MYHSPASLPISSRQAGVSDASAACGPFPGNCSEGHAAASEHEAERVEKRQKVGGDEVDRHLKVVEERLHYSCPLNKDGCNI